MYTSNDVEVYVNDEEGYWVNDDDDDDELYESDSCMMLVHKSIS